MSSQYGMVFDGFWAGPTGRQIAAIGGSAAQLLALYLMANQDANMIGLYSVRLPVIKERIQSLPLKAVERAMWAVGQAEFADYDVDTEYVWVREMAKFRLRLDGHPLKTDDRRMKGAQLLYERAKPNPFLAAFFTRYQNELRLSKKRPFKGVWKPLPSPLVGPTRSGIRDQESLSRNQKSDQVDQDPRALRATLAPIETVRRHLMKAAHEALDNNADISEAELSAVVKDAASACRADYDGREITKIIDAVRGERARRRA